MSLQPQSWIEDVNRGVRSNTPTLAELVDPNSRWLAVAAVMEHSSSTWLIVPDRDIDATLRALAEHLPNVQVGSVVEPPKEGLALLAESWFFDLVAMRWLSRVQEKLPDAMVMLLGDGFVERCREALTRSVRDRKVVAMVTRRVRVGRLLGCTAVLPADLCRDLQAQRTVPIVNDHPNWVAYLERELGGTTLKSRPIDVGPMLAHTFAKRAVVVLGEALAVGGSMRMAADELGFDSPVEVYDDEARWDDLTLFTPPMPETSSGGWPYAVADAAWQAIRSVEGRSLVFGSTMNRVAIERRVRRPLRVMGEVGSGVMFAGPRELDELGTFPLVVIDRLPFPNTLRPVVGIQRHRRLRWFEEVALPKAVQQFRRVAKLVEPGGTLVVLDHRIRSRAFGEAFTDALSCVHITDWEGFLPTLDDDFDGGVR